MADTFFDSLKKKYSIGQKTTSAPQVKVVQAQPTQRISGVVSAQPNTMIRPPSFIGPIMPTKNALTYTPKPIIPIQNSNTTPASLGNIALEQQNANPVIGFFKELPGAFAETAKTIARAPGRTALSVMSSAFNKQSAEPFQATTPVQKFIAGDEPITPIARQAADLELKLKEKGGTLGKLATPLGVTAPVLMGTLDLFPGFGGADAKLAKEATTLLAEQLAKGVAKDEVLNIIAKKYGSKILKQVEEKALPKIEEQLVKQGTETALPKILPQTDELGLKINELDKRFVEKPTVANKKALNLVKEEYQKTLPSFESKVNSPRVSSAIIGKDLKFVNTVKESPFTLPELSAKLESIQTVGITNPETLAKAKVIVNGSVDDAWKIATQTRPTAVSFTTAELLTTKLVKLGELERAIDLVEITALKAKQQGQAIQALSIWNRLTPEGVLRFADRQFTKANELLPKKNQLKLTPEFIKRLTSQAENLQLLKDGTRQKVVDTAMMLKYISDQIPVSIGKKIAFVQTMGQLLNPKTLVRNILGNTGFAVAENVKDVIATPMDWLISKMTGERTKSLPSLTRQTKGFIKGLKEGFEDAWLGINTTAAATQFDLPKGQVFKDKILGGLEKTLSIALKSPDRAAYQAAFENSLASQMKLAGVSKATPEMLHVAHLDGLYRTFQDDSLAAQAFVGIKKALNVGKDFGVGDFLLKYPKTPGNLLARGIDYSPAGFLKSVIELAKPLFGKGFNQRAFVESTSRAITGTTGLVGTGMILYKLGIITGKRDTDTDINALQRSTGLGQYKVNLSGLMRFVLTGFDPSEAKLKEGDRTISYDWFQPAAIPISIGANIAENGAKAKGIVGSVIASIGEGVNTLAEQPLVQGLTRPFRYAESISDSALKALQSVPTSFIPTLLGQIRQVVDKSQRNIQDPNYIQETLNLVKNKIPGLSKMLPEKYGALGEKLTNEQDPISTFVSPAFLDKYVTTPEQRMVLDIYNNSGLKTQAPRLVPAKQTINGESINLTGKQQSEMQKVMGQLTQVRFAAIAKNSAFKRLNDEDKAKELASVMSDINSAAKYELLGNRPKNLSKRTKKYVKIIRKERAK